MGSVYMGIDPGSKGFISIINHNEEKRIVEFYSILDLDFYELSELFAEIKAKYPNIRCVMELVHALHGSSAKSTFSFGEINGLLKGLLIANKIPYHLVQPKKWQNEIWDFKDMVITYKDVLVKDKVIRKKDVNTKQTSINAAKRLFPNIDFRKSERCKNIDDNKVDSILLSEYGRRLNL